MSKKKPDHILLGTIIVTMFVGLAALLSASVAESHKDFGNIYSYFNHQLIYGILTGIVAGLITYRIPYKKWRLLALPMVVASIFFLLLVFIPTLSAETGGAKRWISIFGLSLQPAEFAKLSFIIYLAAWFEGRRSKASRWSEGFVPFLVLVSIFGVLIILQPDIGTLGVISLTAAFIYFVAGASIPQMGAIVGLGAGLLFVLVKLASYRLDRIISFWNSSEDPLGISYQINQALLAIGSGGIFGVGFGKGMQKYNFLPEPMKDSIFAAWSEESGFIGAIFLVTLFVLIAFRGLRISKNTRDRFGKLLALGITFWITSQAFINISSMIGLLPLTGIPLPLVSYGGSSMLVTLAGLGILLNISKHN